MAISYTYIQKNSTLSCIPPEIPHEETASEFLLAKCRQHAQNGKSTWTTDSISGESYTFAQVDELSKSLASAFYKRGLRKGDIVVYMCYDIVKLHIFLNGVWRANGIPRSLYPEELEDSILRTVTESKAKWILCDVTHGAMCLAVAKKVNWPLEVITTGLAAEGCISIYDLFQDDGSECPPLETTKDDTAIIMCTSGTTGPSKGAMHSHKNVVNMMHQLVFHYNFAEPVLYVSKGTHVSGALMCLATLPAGKRLVTMSRISLENVFSAFETYKPGFMFAFPTYLNALMGTDNRAKNIDKSCLEVVLAGGMNLKPAFESDLKEAFVNLKYLSNMYGLTETVPLISTTYKPNSLADPKQFDDLPFGSLGKVSYGVSLQVRDSTGKVALGPNEEGEFCVQNTIMFCGYLGQEEETRNTFTEDGWFKTGDIGYYDENGFLFFSSRKKEMFKCSGNHVYPAQIDDIIASHPDVVGVCTIGVDDPEGEMMPRAFVVLKPGSNASANEIKEFAHERLPVYKHLKGGLYCVPSLPEGSSGKVTRLLVSKMPIPE